MNIDPKHTALDRITKLVDVEVVVTVVVAEHIDRPANLTERVVLSSVFRDAIRASVLTRRNYSCAGDVYRLKEVGCTRVGGHLERIRSPHTTGLIDDDELVVERVRDARRRSNANNIQVIVAGREDSVSKLGDFR